MFIKKANGYVIPVELYIKFHYSIDYQYTFLAVIKPFYEMAPFADGVKYNHRVFRVMQDITYAIWLRLTLVDERNKTSHLRDHN